MNIVQEIQRLTYETSISMSYFDLVLALHHKIKSNFLNMEALTRQILSGQQYNSQFHRPSDMSEDYIRTTGIY